ncbi:MAG TPA: hypothetical protein DDY91_11485 [Planctomycetaceae bacterium]|nr:hypothetical protein [Planctomycetaceae bacterium]
MSIPARIDTLFFWTDAGPTGGVGFPANPVLSLTVGLRTLSRDLRKVVRPEVTAVTTLVMSPEYRQRPEPVQEVLRGGSVELV